MKPCKTCPFYKDAKNIGNREWLIDVLGLLFRGSLKHSCHTTDKNADGYIGGEKRDCAGIKFVAENDKLGVHLHKKFFKNWLSFFKHHQTAQEICNGDSK